MLQRTLGVPLFQEQLLRMAMIAAGFTGGEAEELRRAMGFKRSEKRMADIEVKLRAGMERNGITGKAQEDIVRSITSFALYGFPESHAASFALLAYASAYLKCHYLAAFTCAMLNNQPMGFYSPAILIKDAQRHGLRVLPVDVSESDWECTRAQSRDRGSGPPYASACATPADCARKPAARSSRARPFIERGRPGRPRPRTAQRRAQPPGRNRRAELARPAYTAATRSGRRSAPSCPWARCSTPLEEKGAAFAARRHEHRRAPVGRLPRHRPDRRPPPHGLPPRRDERAGRDARHATWRSIRNGRLVRIAGSVIVRQRPGTAKGFVFLSMEDETGIMNAIVTPDTFDRFKFEVLGEPFLLIDGVLQNLDGVISVKAAKIEGLRAGATAESHDFH